MSTQASPLTIFLIGLATLIVGLVSSIFLFAFGLILVEFLVYPLALGVSAVFSAITATGLSNWWIKDGRHTPPRPVVIVAVAVALAVALLLILLSVAGMMSAPLIFFAVPTVFVVAVTAVLAALRYRTQQAAVRHAIREAVIWIILAVTAVPLTIFIASLFGWAGA